MTTFARRSTCYLLYGWKIGLPASRREKGPCDETNSLPTSKQISNKNRSEKTESLPMYRTFGGDSFVELCCDVPYEF